MELSPARAELIGDRLAALEALGFTCERFGAHSFLVARRRTCPTRPSAATLEEVLEEASDERDDWRERLLIRLACRSAIRRRAAVDAAGGDAPAGAAWAGRAAPAVCPHGAPIVLHFGRKFLERQFAW